MRALGAPFTAEETAAFVAEARRQVALRTPFLHMGRDPRFGLDCAGLPQWCAKSLGRSVWDLDTYGTEPHRDGLRGALVRNLGEPVFKKKPAQDIPPDIDTFGLVVLMRFEGEPKHVGILAHHRNCGLTLIHTYGTIKRVTEHPVDAFWRSMILEGYRP